MVSRSLWSVSKPTLNKKCVVPRKEGEEQVLGIVHTCCVGFCRWGRCWGGDRGCFVFLLLFSESNRVEKFEPIDSKMITKNEM